MSIDLAGTRRNYHLQSLSEKEVNADPIIQFQQWLQMAMQTETEPNAMMLATCTPDGKPSARIVLLKGVQHGGFVFFTNYDSKKGKQIEKNPYGSLVFFWKQTERQVRIEGVIKKISEQESDEYFASRPEESQIGAWSSPQSKVIENREVLENNATENRKKFQSKKIPRPSNWGGYMLKPVLIEFWQGRSGRLHDRLQYTLQQNESWIIERLAP
jgi:pyridoxamine 5'-phosphate oxidase